MVERLSAPEAARELARRVHEAGAGELLRLLIEYGGSPLPPYPELQPEADVLAHWGIAKIDARGWQLAGEMVVALRNEAEWERFFLVTLLQRLDEDDFVALHAQLGVVASGSKAARVTRLMQAVCASADPAVVDVTACEQTIDLAALPVVDIASVSFAEHPSGGLFEVEMADGSVHSVVARELVEANGLKFRRPTVRGVEVEPFAIRQLSVPEYSRVGGLITFASVRALNDALEHESFAGLVAERIGERRVTLRPETSIQEAHLALTLLGLEPSLAAG